MSKIDAHTVQITIDSPISFFLQTLSYPTADVVEKGTPLGGLTTTNPKAHQVSSGPWMISKYSNRNSLTFVPNPGWFASIFSEQTPEVGLNAALTGQPEE